MREKNGADRKRMQKLVEKRNERLDGGGLWRAADLVLTLLAAVAFALDGKGNIRRCFKLAGRRRQSRGRQAEAIATVAAGRA